MPPVPTWFRGREHVRAFFAPILAAQGPRRVLRVDGADTLMFAGYRGRQAPFEGYSIRVLHPQAARSPRCTRSSIARCCRDSACPHSSIDDFGHAASPPLQEVTP